MKIAALSGCVCWSILSAVVAVHGTGCSSNSGPGGPSGQSSSGGTSGGGSGSGGGVSSGGSGASSSGGFTNAGSSSGGVGCGLSETNPTCDACLQTSCCSAATACSNDSSCGTLVNCLALAPFSDGGVDACNAAATPAAQQEYATFESCMTSMCSASCASCHGIPGPCSLNSGQTSCTTAGCTWSGTCTGSSLGCTGLDQFTCGSTLGCYYDSISMFCSGSTPSCSSHTTQYTCTNQSGCYWQSGCTGFSAVTCSSLADSVSCVSAGCTWN